MTDSQEDKNPKKATEPLTNQEITQDHSQQNTTINEVLEVEVVPATKVTSNSVQESNYAWVENRIAAYIIDGIIFSICVSILTFIVSFPIQIALGIQVTSQSTNLNTINSAINILNYFIGLFLSLAFGFLYNAYAESSPWQATIGKKIVGIKVVDSNNQRITLSQGTIRYFVKWAQTLLFISRVLYLMCSFNEKNQNLHDIVADTYVVRAS